MILDIILILIIVLSAYAGYKKGFIHMLIKFLSKLISISVAYLYYKPFKNFLIKFTKIDEFIFDKVRISLNSLGGHASQTTVSGSDLEALSKMTMPDILKEKIVAYLTNTGSELGRSVVLSISDLIMTVISMVLLFIAISILIKFIDSSFNLIAKLPVINGFNKAGGIIFSLFTSYVVLTIVFLLASSLLTMSVSFQIKDAIESSIIASALIKYNPFLVILANIHF